MFKIMYMFKCFVAFEHEWIQINTVMKTGSFNDTGVLWNNFLYKWNKTYCNKLFQAQLLKILKCQQLNQLPRYIDLSESHRVCYNFKQWLSVSQFLFQADNIFDPLTIW